VNLKLVPLFALLAMPALAQASATPWQAGVAGDWSPATKTSLNIPGQGNVTLSQNPRIGVSVLAGYSFLNLGQADLSATAEYQFSTNFRTTLDSSNIGGNFLVTTNKMSSAAIGAQMNFHEPFDFGFGVQGKYEWLSNSNLSINGYRVPDTKYVRPWVMAYGGYTFDLGTDVKPFVALRGSAALTSTSQPSASDFVGNVNYSLQKWLKAADANYQISLAAGVRF